MKKRPLVFFVVLEYNGLEHLKYCLPSIFSQDYPNVRVVVVDNGRGESREYVRKNFPQADYIMTGANLGWSGGNNVGILHALSQGADYMVMANNDTRFDRRFASAMVAAGEKDKAAGILVGKYYLFGTKRFQVAGGGFFDFKDYFKSRLVGVNELDRGQYDEPRYLDHAYEAALVVKAGVFEKIGLFDPAWYLAVEGPDLCLRASKAGIRTRYVPGAVVEHKVGSSFKSDRGTRPFSRKFLKNQLEVAKNGFRFVLKHYPPKAILGTMASGAASNLMKIRKPHLTVLFVYGILWNLLHLPQTIALRQGKREDYEDAFKPFLKGLAKGRAK